MSMTSQARELLRIGILSALESSGAYRPTIPVLQRNLKMAGYPQATEEEIKEELLYLRDKGMAEQEKKTISPENSGWRITATGRDHLAEEGLA